jgi:hypothetical protein
MYARCSTFRGRPDAIEAGLEYVRCEALPTVLVMDGCVGMSMLANRETGLCIAASAWTSPQARTESEGEVCRLRKQLGEHLGGDAEVEEWEIALLHRDHWSQDGARVRVTWVETSDVDRLVDFTRTVTLPAYDLVRGFCSASLMVDREAGRGAVAVSFDNPAAEEDSRETARALREKYVDGTRDRIVDVEQFDLALAHLHAPELV